MVALKPDADRIRSFLKDLPDQDWLKRSERRVWPLFLYHYTDIINAVQILHDGCIYSRKQILSRGKNIVDSASSGVLAGTRDPVMDYVRLYFRPKTPTQYHSEGIYSKARLAASRFPDAHCPVPIFFLFDSAEILTRASSRFSDGCLGSQHARILSTADEFEQLPWKGIYHNSRFNPSSAEGRDIVFRRNAEVIVPKKADLGALRFIYCRSQAEKETLLHLLTPDLRQQYGRKIVATPRSEHYFRRQTFIQTARLNSDSIRLHFSPETQSPGPFHARVQLNTGLGRRSLENGNFNLATLGESLIWVLMLRPPVSNYEIRIFLDGYLAYANSHHEADLPF
jgi:hypothetical protein